MTLLLLLEARQRGIEAFTSFEDSLHKVGSSSSSAAATVVRSDEEIEASQLQAEASARRLQASQAELAGAQQELARAAEESAAGVEGASEREIAALKGVEDAQKKVALDAQASADAQKAANAEQIASDEKTAAAAEASAHRRSAAMRSVGLAGAVAAAGVAMIAVASVKAATKFQSDMEMIHTQAGVAQSGVDQLGQAVIKLAPTVGMGPDELSTGLYHLASQGLRGAQAMGALKIAAEGAQIGGANLEDVTNALGASIVSGIKGVQNMGQAMGSLNAIVGAGDMHMQDLADAMSTGILASAKTFGLSLTDVGSALAVFGDNNIRGSAAATKLRMAISLMGAPTQAAAKALKTVGMTSTEMGDDMRKPNGLLVALTDLKNHLDASGESATQQAQTLSRAFGGGRTASAILILLDQLGRLQSKYKAIGDGAKNFGADWQATTKTAVFQSKSLHASFQALEVAIGQALLPVVQKLLAMVIKILGPVLNWIEAHKKLAAIIMVVIGALGALVAIIAVVSAVITALSGPVGLVVLAITALIAIGVLLYKNWDTISKFAERVWHDVAGFFERMYHDVAKFVGQIIDWIKKNWPLIVAIFLGPTAVVVALFVKFHSQIFALAERIWHDVVNFFTHLWHDTTQVFSNLVRDVVNFFTSLPGKLLGAVAGFGSLLLSAGEDLIKGLIHGITNMVGSAVDAVKHVGSSILHGIGHFFGIGSPSKVMADQVGVPLAQGIAVGLTKGLPAVHAAMTAGLAGLGATATVGLTGVGGLTGATGGGVTINITGNTFATQAQISDLADQIGQVLVGKLAPAGIRIRR